MTNQTVSIASRQPEAADPNSSRAKKLRFRAIDPRLWRRLAFGLLPGLASATMTCGDRIIDRGTSGAELQCAIEVVLTIGLREITLTPH